MADNTAGQTRTPALDQGTGGGLAQGKIVLDATAIVVTDTLRVVTGFKPRHVLWRTAAGVTCEWFEGMAANTAMKSDAVGAYSLAGNGVTVDPKGFRMSQNAALAAVLASGTIYWQAEA